VLNDFWGSGSLVASAPDSAQQRLRCTGFSFGLAAWGWEVRLGAMVMKSELQKHHALLLVICGPWSVKTVDPQLEEQKVKIQLQRKPGSPTQCPECGRDCAIHDAAPERSWRQLDTLRFATSIRARTPRSECPEHGVRTTSVPWVVPKGRFTLLFERFALDVLLVCASVSRACSLLRIHWAAAQQIVQWRERWLGEPKQTEANGRCGPYTKVPHQTPDQQRRY
jgi:hypothetical protein